jgi:transposase
VVDNAAVHVGQDMFPYLTEMLDLVGAFLVRLPVYSPEFDPCEYVFGELKESLRRRHEPGMSLPARVYAGLQRVSYENIGSYYWQCTRVGLSRLAAGF